MASIKLDVRWTPYADQFFTFGNDLRLYGVKYINNNLSLPSGAIQLSDASYAQLIATNTDVQYAKCISCYPKIHSEGDVVIAAGQTSGKIVITGFHPNPESYGLVGLEFVPKHMRQCNCVDLNDNLLCAGFDKFRNDCAVYVWNVQRSTDPNTYDPSNAYKTIYEYGQGELANSVKWFPNQNMIVCGLNNKHLKLLDIRSNSGKPKQTTTKAVYGVTFDPFYEFRFASYFENQIYVWDHRNFDKPLTIVPIDKPLVKIEWCSTRPNMLASLTRECTSIKLIDIKDYINGNNDVEPAVIDRVINPFQPNSQSPISSFSWHPTDESRMILVTTSGFLRDFRVVDRITLNWSPASEIIWTHGKKILQCIDPRDALYPSIDDIAVRMRSYALEGYGIEADKLYHMFTPYSPLYDVWKWVEKHVLQMDKSLYSKNSISNKEELYNSCDPEGLFGVRAILMQSSKSINRSEVIEVLDNNDSVSNNNHINYIRRFYKSSDRLRAIKHCGWDFNLENENSTSKFIPLLESQGKWANVAAIYVFTGRIKKAIQTLKKAADSGKDKLINANFGAIAMALTGHTNDKNSLWREMCKSMTTHLMDPYLKAIFTFLMSDSDDYSEILNETKLSVIDRICFACLYLSDIALGEYMDYLHSEMIKNGNLAGIILTGITNEGLDLFERYVEETTDVQTISLILLHALPNQICQTPRAKMWIDNYRLLLDRWRLWNVRCRFDIEWYKALLHLEEPKQQIFVSCNYCGHPVSSYISSSQTVKAQETYQQQLSHHQYNRSSVTASTNKSRIQSCPTCRKPLPRCALCLLQMGTPSGSYWRPGLTFSKDDPKLTPFSTWFTWCQTCRHGGHASHIMDWFKNHVECPVAGCGCKCMCIDGNAKLSPDYKDPKEIVKELMSKYPLKRNHE